MKRYRTLKDELTEKYGKRLYKIAIDGHFTCPNRDGTKGVGGCIFCSGEGSGEFTESGVGISEQIRSAKERYSKKLRHPENAEYIAYFQSFTGTYAPIETLQKLYYEATCDEKIKVISIGTRPDCIDNYILNLLSKINEKKDLWIELGLQTANDNTAEAINRCYKTEIYDDTVKKLKERNIKVITHLILGLPSETHEDEINSLNHIVNCKTDGVKFHLLYGVKGTRLVETDYTPLSKEEYIKRVCDLIRRTPENITIHRLTGDGDKKTLVYPKWSTEKIEVLNAIDKYLETNNFRQGDLS